MNDGWLKTTLGAHIEIVMGQAPPGKDCNKKGVGVPFVKAGEFTNGFPIIREWTTNPLRYSKSGDTLICVVGATCGKLSKGIDCAIGRSVAALRPRETLDAGYLWNFMAIKVQEMREGSRGSAQGVITKEDLSDLQLALPPLVEQRRIVDLVSSVDAYIDALQQQADVAREARNAVLHELLSAGGENWTETTLGEIGLTGLFVDGDWVESKDQDPAGQFRLLQLADVGDGVFLDKSNRWMNSEQFSRLRCTSLHPRDILIARMPDPIARACVLPSGLPTCATVVDVAILRCGEGFVPEFIALVINDSVFRAGAQSLLTGTTRQRISRSNLAMIVLAVPSVAEQERIVATVLSMDEVIHSTQQAVSDAQNLRSGLLSELLSGEHVIPESYDRLLGAA
jgi:type I restriction enzyme S subunit